MLKSILQNANLGSKCFLPGTMWYVGRTPEWIYRARGGSQDRRKKMSAEQSRLLFRGTAIDQVPPIVEIYYAISYYFLPGAGIF